MLCRLNEVKTSFTEVKASFTVCLLQFMYISKTVPVLKSGDELDANNYRPISLLSNFNRIFEMLMFSKMISLIKGKGLLYQAQYGFHKAHSTQHAILDIINTIQTNMDKRLFSCGIFIILYADKDIKSLETLVNFERYVTG